ncbi:hypothetical protein RI129_002226 [Pyrocoelia pectoralis]|uniref:Apple domain-containing protein n=1 Tax=Pyrocoelia pectoralis TaxID=417401 RepID=A0AAN7VIP8_9COLE
MSENKMRVIFLCVIFEFVNALTIDNQLTIVRNDCYERLALGHKLNSRDVDKEFQLSTVQECQMACTEEGDTCRSFSFGVGVKGNATCSLSKHSIKETPDLKPIGTLIDVDYDLYIKKLGCKLILHENQSQHGNVDVKPPENDHFNNISYQPVDAPFPSSKPYRVQSSMISISPSSVYPEDPLRYGTAKPHQFKPEYSNDRPPFRPTHLNHPYGDRPHQSYPPQANDRFDFDPSPHVGSMFRPPGNRYEIKPLHGGSSGYDGGVRPFRPNKIPTRPFVEDEYESFSKPPRPDNQYEYTPFRPDNVPNRPQHFISTPQAVVIDNYGSRPQRPIKIPERPDDHYNKPLKPIPPEVVGGHYNSRPQRPLQVPNRPDDYYQKPPSPNRPIQQATWHDRPTGGYNTVINNRPNAIPDRPDSYGQRPHHQYENDPPHTVINNRPDSYGQRPHHQYENDPPHTVINNRPNAIPDRPDSYGQRPHHQYETDRPHGYISKPSRPIKVPERPVDSNGYDSISPHRPNKIPHKPDNYDYVPDTIRPGSYRPQSVDRYEVIKPHRPNHIPERPNYDEIHSENLPYYWSNQLDYGSQAQRPSRPHRPLTDGYEIQQRPYGAPDRPENIYNSVHSYYEPKPKHSQPGFDEYEFDDYDFIPPRPSKPYFPQNGPKLEENYDHLNLTTNKTTIAISDNTTVPENDNYVPTITHTVGPYGDTITAIMTEIKEACFRRVLAGKRVVRSLVRKAVPCERVEDCQRECSDERRFVCEGFNYRLDPTGRGQGDCELLEVPLSRLNIRQDVVSDPEYDYYERDRNSDGPDCKGTRYYGSYSNRREDFHNSYERRDYDSDYYEDSDRYYYRYRPYPGIYNDFLYYDDRRGGYKYDRDDYEYDKADLPRPDYKSHEPYLPHWHRDRDIYDRDKWYKYNEDRLRDKEYWGFKDQNDRWGSYGGSYGNFGKPHRTDTHKYDYHNKYNDSSYRRYYSFPYEEGDSKDWGRYGGTYGYGGYKDTHYKHKDSYDYWGFNKLDEDNALLPPYESKPEYSGSYLPPYDKGHDYLDIQHGYDHRGYDDNYVKDQCSLRMATGFRMHRGTIKKIISVPHIYECEILCHKEKDFPCSSYTFRYTLLNNAPKENCHLSDRDYKELDYYTDLEPDRDCDVYTINNRESCVRPITTMKESSDCFLRVRSGQRLDHRVVRDSLTVKSIVDCQLECIRSHYFTCRGFSFRYGSPSIGGSIDNCQLTDWPIFDLNPRIHFVPENGYEIYERRSYGHGCEPNFGNKMDQLCYVGYGTQAKLLPQATKKSIWTATEAECKAECTRTREKGDFQCMSFSYRGLVPKGSPNCDISDILQRDLLSNVDYVPDPDSWLFAWDLHNPQCVSVIIVGNTIFGGEHLAQGHDKEGGGVGPWDPSGRPQDTWKFYTVSGYPCKRGNVCQENTVAGFWYCEIDGREEHSWDYCFPYQWCYVGPKKTQWRKCNDRYYPYGTTDRYDYPHVSSYLPETTSNHLPPIVRPNRPPAEEHYLDPPKPGGFGQTRHWPISYLHKELPQNDSLPDIDPTFDFQKLPKPRNADNKDEAIGNVIKTIQSNELKNGQYQVLNATDNSNYSVPFKIPLPLNVNKSQENIEFGKFQTVDLLLESNSTHSTGRNPRRERSGRPYTRGIITKTSKPVTNASFSKTHETVSA